MLFRDGWAVGVWRVDEVQKRDENIWHSFYASDKTAFIKYDYKEQGGLAGKNVFIYRLVFYIIISQCLIKLSQFIYNIINGMTVEPEIFYAPHFLNE